MEREYAEIEEQLLTEVLPPNPVSTKPSGANISLEPQHQYPARWPNIFPVASLGNIPTSAVWTEEVQVLALKKPYLGAPMLVSQGLSANEEFNLGQAGQSKIPQFFAMGS